MSRTFGPTYPPRRYYYQRDEDDASGHAGAVTLMLVGIIVFIVILFVVLWLLNDGQRRKRHDDNLKTSSEGLPRDSEGKVLLASGGLCSSDRECRTGLSCFEGKCRTQDRVEVAKALEAKKRPRLVAPRVRLEAALLPSLASPIQEEEEQPRPQPHVAPLVEAEDADSVEEAHERGLSGTLRMASAVSSGAQEFGFV